MLKRFLFAITASFGVLFLSSHTATDCVPTDIILVFSADSDAGEQEAFLSALPESNVIWHENDAALLRTTVSDIPEYLADLRQNHCVAAADCDAPLELTAVSQDAYTNAQWALNNTGYYSFISDMNTSTILGQEDIDMNIPEAWAEYEALCTSPREVVVAVIDTGVDINHPDLAANIWHNDSEIPDDGIDNDGNGYIDDICGWDFYNSDNTVCHYAEDKIHALETDNDNHGTHVAGIIAAVRNNGIGIAGVASCADVRIMPLKIHGGQKASGTIANAVRAIQYATAMGADICNISWGTTKPNSTLEQAIHDSDMLFVAAAGNTGTDNNTSPIYPASYDLDNIISVSFIDASGNLSAKSNYGSEAVDLAAPGVHIYSTCVGDYVSLSGSSMSTPQVSGVAALLYSFGDHQYPANIKDILLQTCKPVASLEGKTKYAGIPDAAAALQAIGSLRYDYTAPKLSFAPSFSGTDLALTVTAADKNGSGVRTIRYASGIHDINYFRRGTAESSVSPGETLTFSKAAKYTFYVSDYAGNERAMVYQLVDDVTPPTADLSYQVPFSRSSFTVRLTASDSESGVRLAKYAAGEHDISYFRSGTAGNEISLTENNTGNFKVKTAGCYTVYLVDYRGNKSVHTINAEIIPSTSLKLHVTQKKLKVGKSYQLVASVLPSNTTDKLQYTSSDTSICKVNSSGRITAIAAGKAVITVKTASGLTQKCTITVTE